MAHLLSKPIKSLPRTREQQIADPSKDLSREAADDARLLTESEVAGLLRLSVKTLRNWRFSGFGPRHLKMGRLVRYRLGDVKAWLASCQRASTSDQGGDDA
jgi:predicted DNA-binding transcriptional regulator AlpA